MRTIDTKGEWYRGFSRSVSWNVGFQLSSWSGYAGIAAGCLQTNQEKYTSGCTGQSRCLETSLEKLRWLGRESATDDEYQRA